MPWGFIMFRNRMCRVALATIGVISCTVPVSAAVIKTVPIRFESTSTGGTSTTPQTSLTYKLTMAASTFPVSSDPSLFENQTITTAQSGGPLLVATASTDPMFETIATLLTDGKSQYVWDRWRWGPVGAFNGSGRQEQSYFGLTGLNFDFKGQAIRAIVLQVNFADQFIYTANDGSVGRRSRLEGTLIVSDSETVAATMPPIAVAMAARTNSFYLKYGDTLVLDGSRSLGDIALYQWDLNLDGKFEITTTEPQVSLTASQYAPFLPSFLPFQNPRLTVTDTAGIKSSSNSDSFTYVVPEPSAAAICVSSMLFSLCRRRRESF